jgi:hypothetical protein
MEMSMLYATSDVYGCWFGRAFEETLRSLEPSADTVVFEHSLKRIPPATAIRTVFFFVCDDAFGPHDHASSKVLTDATAHLKPALAEHVPLGRCVALRSDTQELRETLRLALRSFTTGPAHERVITPTPAKKKSGCFVPHGGEPLLPSGFGVVNP